MQQKAYIADMALFTPLGSTLAENWQQLMSGNTALKYYENTSILPRPYYAGIYKNTACAVIKKWQDKLHATYFEAMSHEVIQQIVTNQHIDWKGSDVLCIVATTKGNIDHIATDTDLINASLKNIKNHWGFYHNVLGISNACISGSLAIITAQRMIEQGLYKYVLVVGADKLDKFVLNGFNAFQAISKGLCKPFDATRDGINLGEAAAAMLISSKEQCLNNKENKVVIGGGGITNDANHLSGPSRTGAELGKAINDAMLQAGISAQEVGCISAHGTGTIFNDEMESKAIALNQLSNVPLYSLKSYYGHTLGASGVLESIISIEAMLQAQLLPSLNYASTDVSGAINIQQERASKKYYHLLKTASGFGGCNAAVVFSMEQ